jgi:hypothetical protein
MRYNRSERAGSRASCVLRFSAVSLGAQVTDTPGLLRRPEDERNGMERLTLAALAYLPTAAIFVTDLTGDCGTSVADQWAIRCDWRRPTSLSSSNQSPFHLKGHHVQHSLLFLQEGPIAVGFYRDRFCVCDTNTVFIPTPMTVFVYTRVHDAPLETS